MKTFQTLCLQDLLDALRGDLSHYTARELDQFEALSRLCLPSATERFRLAAIEAEGREKSEADEHHAACLASLEADRRDFR